MHVVALPLVERMRGDRDREIEITAGSRSAGAFARHPHPLAALHAGRNPHLDLSSRSLPAAAAARRARLTLDVTGALTARARLVEVQRERLPRPVKRFLEGDLRVGLDVRAAAALAPPEEVFEADAAASRPVRAHVTEDGPEEVREVGATGLTAIVDSKATARAPGRRGVALPVWSERVVTLSLLRVRENLVRLADFLEALARVLALRDVRVVLPRQPSVGGLDCLVVRLSVDAQNSVVVLEVDCHATISLRV